jgi:hypothetical protein
MDAECFLEVACLAGLLRGQFESFRPSTTPNIHSLAVFRPPFFSDCLFDFSFSYSFHSIQACLSSLQGSLSKKCILRQVSNMRPIVVVFGVSTLSYLGNKYIYFLLVPCLGPPHAREERHRSMYRNFPPITHRPSHNSSRVKPSASINSTRSDDKLLETVAEVKNTLLVAWVSFRFTVTDAVTADAQRDEQDDDD